MKVRKIRFKSVDMSKTLNKENVLVGEEPERKPLREPLELSIYDIQAAKGANAWEILCDLNNSVLENFVLTPVRLATECDGKMGIIVRYGFAENFCRKFKREIITYYNDKGKWPFADEIIVNMVAFTANYSYNVFLENIIDAIAAYRNKYKAS